jgi:hypothetical protein
VSKEDIADIEKKQDKKEKIRKNASLANIGFIDTSTLEEMVIF